MLREGKVVSCRTNASRIQISFLRHQTDRRRRQTHRRCRRTQRRRRLTSASMLTKFSILMSRVGNRADARARRPRRGEKLQNQMRSMKYKEGTWSIILSL